jgi:hypothetical protein
MKTYTQVLGWVNKIKENAEKVVGLTAAEAVSFRNDLAKARDKASGCKDGWLACRSSKKAEVISLCLVYFNFNKARSRKLTKVDAPKSPPKKTPTKKWNAAITAWDDLSDSQRADFLIAVGADEKASK